MLPNLRAVFRPLLDELDLPATEMWEIERAGRTAGLFETGRTGPGGGTPATPRAIVMTVISLLAGLTKRDGVRLAPFYADAAFRDFNSEELNAISQKFREERSYVGATACGLTGATTFGQAIGWLLSHPFDVGRVVEVRIVHTFRMAEIEYVPSDADPGGSRRLVSQFGGRDDGLTVLRATTTTIKNPFFLDLARHLADLGL